MRFIYVKSEKDRDKMLALGYAQFKEDSRNNMWVFRCGDTETFDCSSRLSQEGIQFVLSNTLTF